MDSTTREHRGPITRDATGPSAAEAFVLIAIATILITTSRMPSTAAH
jgi:hypothetical protein